MHSSSDSSSGINATSSVDALTVFTFLWACQALVHQEFYLLWLPSQNIFGWTVTIFGVSALLFPRSIELLSALALCSVIYNVGKWPFVVNHILLESMANIVILTAIAVVTWQCRGWDRQEQRNAIYDRFSPVLMTALVVMYYFAFAAKLNHDFFNVEISCVSKMYGDLVDRFPFLPNNLAARKASIWATLVVEGMIPLLLTFRRTWWIAIAIGMPFHFVLGVIGHRTFSALAYAMYGMFLIVPLTTAANAWIERLPKLAQLVNLGSSHTRGTWLIFFIRATVVLGVASLIGSHVLGHYESGMGPLKFFRVPWGIWILWSTALMFFYAYSFLFHRGVKIGASQPNLARPGLLWLFLLPVFLNGSSQYLGLKTETCFTMYSNLRTEGGINNHLFFPVVKLTNYQDDLVDLLEVSDSVPNAFHPSLAKVLTLLKRAEERDQLVTRFELQRAAELARDAKLPFRVRYLDGGVEKEYDSRANGTAELSVDHPTLLGKLLRFRPVDKGEHMSCQH